MNGPEQPLSSDTLDELLSADLDGELDRAAVELGFTPESARAALEASPGADARRAALLRARDALAETPVLEPDTASRLVAATLAHAADERRIVPPQAVTPLPPHRDRNAWRVLVGVGTAAAVIAGVVALSATNPRGDKSSSSSAKSADVPALGADSIQNGAPQHVEFGAVTPSDAFRAKVKRQLALAQPTPAPKYTQRTGTTIAAGAVNGDTTAGPEAAATDNPSPTSAPSTADGATAIRLRQSCIDELAHTESVPARPVLSGSGTNGTDPVFVVVYRQAGTYVVYVLSGADCSVVSRDVLP
jgi:hypothetical protein